MRKALCILITLFVTGTAFAQAPLKPSELVQYHKSFNSRFTPVSDLFSLQNSSVRNRPDVANEVSDGILLNFNGEMARQMAVGAPEAMTLSIPMGVNNNVEVELVKVNIFAPDFFVSMAAPEKVMHELGTHYRGVVKGMDGSIAAVSIYENEVVGLFSGPRIGNYVLGALKGDNAAREHILYNDANLLHANEFSCEQPDDDFAGYTEEQLSPVSGTRALSDCIRIYMEVDYDIYQDKGSNTTAFVTAEFNEIATMYANENINYTMSQLYINNTSGSAYSNGSSSSLLNQFQSRTGALNGDLGQLITYRSSGGVAAGFSGLCNSNSDNSLCISDIQGNYSAVPTYSWDIDVQTHELGHLNGSRHTHACVWNGNNTAIDGCSGFTEGGCALPGNPSNGGTVMSYCHVASVGKNLALGFGTQPGNVIRNATSNASCLQSCDGGGGGGCDDTEVTVTILTDNYPGETTWEVRNSGGTVVGSGGPYSATGTTYTTDLCLADGCYDFIINDSYGDGICCAYGTGSYTVTAGGSNVASGGAFGSTETKNFCIGGGGGGGNCPAIDFNSYTVTAYGNGQDNGTFSINDGGATLQLNNNAWKDISYNYTVTANTVIEFEFSSTAQGEIHGIGFDNNESITSGYTFKVHGTQNWGITNFDNYPNNGSFVTYQIPVGQSYTGTFNRMIFLCDDDNGGSSNSYFRNVKVYEGSCSSSPAPSWLQQGAEPFSTQLGQDGEYQFEVYPSPVQDQMMTNLEAPAGEYSATILDLSGRVIWTGVILAQEQAHDVSSLPAGMYMLKVRVGDEETITRKVVKTN